MVVSRPLVDFGLIPQLIIIFCLMGMFATSYSRFFTPAGSITTALALSKLFLQYHLYLSFTLFWNPVLRPKIDKVTWDTPDVLNPAVQ